MMYIKETLFLLLVTNVIAYLLNWLVEKSSQFDTVSTLYDASFVMPLETPLEASFHKVPYFLYGTFQYYMEV